MKKKIIALTIILALVLSLGACGKKQKEEAPSGSEAESEADDSTSEEEYSEDPEMVKEFAEFVDMQYKSAIESSYLTMHMYYLDPEAAGLNTENVTIEFGEAPTPETVAEDLAYYNDLKATFETFDRSKLNENQRDEYDAIKWEIDTIVKMLDPKFEYYAQIFVPPNSLDQNIVTYLSSYELRSEREVQELVTLIESIPKYVETSIDYAKVQQEKKLLMTDFDAVVKGCEEVISTGTNSSVLTKLLEKVDERSEISDENKEKYKGEIKEAYEKSYLPSFQKIIDAMNEMKGGYNNEEGYAAFPNGAEYFEIMLNYNLGLTDVSAREIKEYLEAREEKHIDDFSEYVSKTPDAMPYVVSTPDQQERTGYNSYPDILEDMKAKMFEDYPEVKNLEYNVEPADPEEKLEERNIAAYFLIPPLDGDHKQQMRTSPSSDSVDTLDSYMTIAHEGFPGHMYQYAYIYDNLYSDYLKTLGVDGNVEGYAVYAQYNATDYLDNIHEASKRVAIFNSQLGFITYSLADLGINYYGWSLEDTKDFFNKEKGYGLDDEVAKEIYDVLRSGPASYETYSYGYETINDLRVKAEEALGDKFNAKEFNTALLNAGPLPYHIVERHIDEYIKNNK